MKVLSEKEKIYREAARQAYWKKRHNMDAPPKIIRPPLTLEEKKKQKAEYYQRYMRELKSNPVKYKKYKEEINKRRRLEYLKYRESPEFKAKKLIERKLKRYYELKAELELKKII